MLNRILIVVDQDQDNLLALNRASYLAEVTDAHFEFLLCTNRPELHGHGVLTEEEVEAKLFLAEKEKLDELTKPLTNYGYDIESKVIFHKPVLGGLVDRIVEYQADLVIKTSDYRPSINRSLFTYLDWQMIRQCPKPLLLTKHCIWPEQPRIAVAVDPMHENDKPANLDQKLIEEGKKWQQMTNGSLELVHACDSGTVSTAVATQEETEERHEAALYKLADQYQIPHNNVHQLIGSMAFELTNYVIDNNIVLLVMGALSRSLLDRWILGNSAEKLLDKLSCDLLIVKPGEPNLAKELGQ